MFSVKKIWQLPLQVSNICHINNMFRTRSLSLHFTHIRLLLMRVLKIKLYEIGVSRCIIYDFFSIINEIISFWFMATSCQLLLCI